MIDYEEINQYMRTFERVELLQEVILLGVDGGVRRITIANE